MNNKNTENSQAGTSRQPQHTPTKCIEWTGAIDGDGYGRKLIGGKWKLAHRLEYEKKNGLIPQRMVIDHLCRNRRCVNPEHMEVVTSAQNTRRGNGIASLNAKKVFCKNGHPLNGDNLEPDKGGRRQCKTCARARWRAYRARKIKEGTWKR